MDLWEKEYERIIKEEKEAEWRFGKLLKRTCIILLVFMLFGISSCGFQSGRTSRILTNTFGNLFEGKILGNTYINGVGFQNMMAFLEDWQECYMELLNACANNSLSLEEQELKAWNDKIGEFEQEFTSLKYHKSYAELIEVNLQVLSLCKELLSEIQSNESFEVKEDTYTCICNALQLKQEILIKCFDKNGIPHHETDEKINYTFKFY